MGNVVGILGGMGPYATVDFMRLVMDLTIAEKESDHLQMLVDSNPRMPSRTRAFLFSETDPVPAMRCGVNSLVSAGADFIVVPCNSAHYFLPRVFEDFSVPYIDMVESTSNVLIQRGWSRIGVLAGEVTVGTRLYEKFLTPNGVDVVQVDSDKQKLVRRIIEDVKSNSISSTTESVMAQLVDVLQSEGAQSIVLSCTELQAVVRNMSIDIPIVDSTEVLARATIIRAGGAQQEATGE